MKAMKNRMFALLLTVAMMLTFMPAAAFAEDGSVASVNGVGFPTLREAFVGASTIEGETTVTVLKDIDGATFSNATVKNIALGKGEYVLDLNGHTVEAGGVDKAFSLYGTKLTIKDGRTANAGTLTNGKDPAALFALWGSTKNDGVYADLTMESGTIKTKGYAVYLGGASKFTLKDGSVKSTTNTTIQIEGDADGAAINIEGGKVESSGQNAIQNWGKNSTINVSGGVIGNSDVEYATDSEGGSQTGLLNFAICSRNYTDPSDNTKVYSSDGAKITITGGTLIANNAIEMQPGTLYVSGTDSTPVLNGQVSVGGQISTGLAVIAGGQFNGKMVARKNGRYVISGGVFNKELTGYTAIDNNGVDYSREGKYSLTGGKFIEDVNDVCAAGYKAQQSGSIWEVVKESSGGGGGTVTDPVKDVVDAINALPANPSTDAEKAQVEAARKAYDALTAEQKKDERLTADVLKKLTDAEEAIKSGEAQKAAGEVSKAIADLPEDPASSTREQVAAARAAYDALDATAKQLITESELAKLENAEYYWASADAKAQKVILKSVKAKKGKKALAKWKKNAAVDGYQLVYSTSKKFTKKTTKKVTIKSYKTVKKTVKKLKKGKKYYFKIRGFNKVYNPATGKDQKIYGKWSKVKKITAKK